MNTHNIDLRGQWGSATIIGYLSLFVLLRISSNSIRAFKIYVRPVVEYTISPVWSTSHVLSGFHMGSAMLYRRPGFSLRVRVTGEGEVGLTTATVYYLRQRIIFKIATLMHQCLNGLAPPYLATDCIAISSMPVTICSIRTAIHSKLKWVE